MRLLNHGTTPEEEISKMKDTLNLERVSQSKVSPDTAWKNLAKVQFLKKAVVAL